MEILLCGKEGEIKMYDDNHRRIEIYSKNFKIWIGIAFEDLRENDIFRIFDDNKIYYDDYTGNNIWIATSKAYLNKDNIWTVNTLY